MRTGPITIIGPLPPPTTGMSVAFAMLRKELSNRGIRHNLIDITPAGSRRDSRFSVARCLALCARFLEATPVLFHRNGTVYLTIAQSSAGLCRDVVFAMLARMGGHRLIAHLHGGNYSGFYAALGPCGRRLARWLIGSVDRLILLSDAFRTDFDFLPAIGPRIVIVPNGLPCDPDAFSPTPKKLPSNNGPVRILFLSNLIESKGYLLLLDALRELKVRGVAFRCTFCGEFVIGPDSRRYASPEAAEREFQKVIDGAGLKSSVEWVGAVHGERKARYLRESHFLVLPTVYVNEGQPISIIEAMASGTVVIASRHRAIPEMTDNGDAGLLLDTPSPAAIVETLTACMDDPAAFACLSRRAIARYKSTFTREQHLKSLLDILLPPDQDKPTKP